VNTEIDNSEDDIDREDFRANVLSTMSEFVPSVGVSKPRAQYIAAIRLVVLQTKDCSYTADWLNYWSEVFLQNYRPWYAFWKKKYVGFSVYCPQAFGFSGDILVTTLLDRILQEDPTALGKHKKLFYRLAKGYTVYISEEE